MVEKVDAIFSEDVQNKYGDVLNFVLVGATAATAANYSTWYNVPRPMEILEVRVSFTTASTSGTLQLERLTGTQAPGAGSSVFDSTFSLAGTANTVSTKTTRDMTSSRIFYTGDRLAWVDGGTLTNLTDLVVTIYYRPTGRGDYR